jgi:CubicO group peptidase (beta-lactamase class C family)
LEKSFWFAHEAIVWSAAAGHNQPPGQEAPQVALPYAIPRASNPAGAIISCVEDLLTFVQFHMGDGKAGDTQYLTRDTLRAMQEPQATITDTDKWGLGWSLRYINGVKVIQHGGGTNGHITQMLGVPEKGFALSVLTNSSRGGGVIGAVEEWAFRRYCGLTVTKPEPIELPREKLERLTGTYTRPMGTMTITIEDGQLTIAPVYKNPFTQEDMAFPPIKVAPTSEWEIIGTEGDFAGTTAQFIPNADNTAPRFIRFGGRLVPKVS